MPSSSANATLLHTVPRRTLRLLSYNIQIGIHTRRYRHYLTHSWKHVLHHPQRFANLDRIATLMQNYDIVGVQEADAGSARSGFVNITQYLAQEAGFPYWDDQTNRRIGRFARHSLGVLSRYKPSGITEHRLPGRIPGRGAMAVRYGDGEESLVILIVHLALSQRGRVNQLDYLGELINEYRHVVLMGDMNCRSNSPEIERLIDRTLMTEPLHGMNTFPSWRPKRNIDHILVTPTVEVEHSEVLDYPLSDHLPVSMEIVLPETVRLDG
ncbi:Endonuclease/exonuclease/phosphatase family protein [hydrothermal vent metagenome]|uniref:Endonuclease/exonuclease/phosphatase family protein n=1 Tax=hydrothermal vent metagenome TaxID=652676 RepID=A0A3B0ZAA1_9ZZZZ